MGRSGNFAANNGTALNLTTWTVKVDHQISTNDRASVRFILHDFRTTRPASSHPCSGSDRREPAFTFGDSGRTLLSSPGLIDLSTSLLKNMHWRERYELQFRVEALNVLNHPNFNPPGIALGSATLA